MMLFIYGSINTLLIDVLLFSVKFQGQHGTSYFVEICEIYYLM